MAIRLLLSNNASDTSYPMCLLLSLKYIISDIPTISKALKIKIVKSLVSFFENRNREMIKEKIPANAISKRSPNRTVFKISKIVNS